MLAGAVIGAGIFSLPYIFVQVGIVNGLLYLLTAAVVVAVVHWLYAQLAKKEGAHHNFVSFSRYYFGTVGFWLAVFTAVIQMLLVLVIYLILSQSFFNLITNTNSFLTVFLFWLIGSAAVFLNIKRLAAAESFIVSSITAIVVLIFIISWPRLLTISPLIQPFSWRRLLIAIGPLFFALSGRVAVVEMVRYVKRTSIINQSIVLGTFLPAVVYGLFAVAVIALSAEGVSQDAVTGLIGHLSPLFLGIIGLLGLLGILGSYIAVGFDVNDILKNDLRWPTLVRALTVAGVPLGLYLAGWQNFLQLVSFSGGVFGALTFIIIILMWLKAFQKKSFAALLLLGGLLLILVSQLLRFTF